MKKYFGTLFSLSLLILAGCGSSSSSTKIGSGIYVDSAVWGVEYSCGSENGTTDINGNFNYEVGKECKFFINNLAFKKIDSSKLNNLNVVIQENDVAIARFLQSLDQDGNATNGIEISADVAKEVTKIARSDKDINELVDKLKDNIDTYNGNVVSLKEAKEHLDKSISVKTSLVPVIDISTNEARQGENVVFDASSSKGDIEKFTWKNNDEILSTKESFTISSLPLGINHITLYIEDQNGEVKEKSVTINILPPATKWDIVNPILEDENSNKLYITSDDDNIYLKFESGQDMNSSELEKVKFYINSDDSNISGLSTYSAGVGLDYLLTSYGAFHLRDKNDYTGIKVQETGATIKDNSVEVVIDKQNIEYLAQKIYASVLIMGDDGVKFAMNGSSVRYTIPNYIEPEDKIAPVITINGDNPTIMNVNDIYTEAGASAIDVVDGEVQVAQPVSNVDSTKAGVYEVKYTAEDSNGNSVTKYRVVEVKGASSVSTFEVKSIGEYNDVIAINHENGQVWMNDNRDEGENRGCLVTTTGASEAELKKDIEGFCEASKFAGFSDWRVPTPLELSKFTVKMKQEGIAPGIARKHCVKTLAIDSEGMVKGVNTHITNLAGLIVDGELTPSGARCVRGDIDNTTGDFTIKEDNGGKVIIDDTNSSKSLMWVNEYKADVVACLAIHTESDLNTSKTFCSTLDYAGYNDWRDPTSEELSNFVVKTNEVHILPGYEAPCSRLLAKDGNVSKAVYTRFDTDNVLGDVINLEENLTSSIGLRCVRDN